MDASLGKYPVFCQWREMDRLAPTVGQDVAPQRSEQNQLTAPMRRWTQLAPAGGNAPISQPQIDRSDGLFPQWRPYAYRRQEAT
ncbi:MAG: hypothetical protein CL878_03605 [Dehalococcoidia bacterium]|nr:hypothetical protein [Dehalococcoidia bacterium]